MKTARVLRTQRFINLSIIIPWTSPISLNWKVRWRRIRDVLGEAKGNKTFQVSWPKCPVKHKGIYFVVPVLWRQIWLLHTKNNQFQVTGTLTTQMFCSLFMTNCRTLLLLLWGTIPSPCWVDIKMTFDTDAIIQEFARRHPRCLPFAGILDDEE